MFVTSSRLAFAHVQSMWSWPKSLALTHALASHFYRFLSTFDHIKVVHVRVYTQRASNSFISLMYYGGRSTQYFLSNDIVLSGLLGFLVLFVRVNTCCLIFDRFLSETLKLLGILLVYPIHICLLPCCHKFGFIRCLVCSSIELCCTAMALLLFDASQVLFIHVDEVLFILHLHYELC